LFGFRLPSCTSWHGVVVVGLHRCSRRVVRMIPNLSSSGDVPEKRCHLGITRRLVPRAPFWERLGGGGETEGDKGDTTLSRIYLPRMQTRGLNLPTSVHPSPNVKTQTLLNKLLISFRCRSCTEMVRAQERKVNVLKIAEFKGNNSNFIRAPALLPALTSPRPQARS